MGVQVSDVAIIDLILSILDSPYANHLTRQFVFASITKISSRPTTSPNQQERIAAVLAGYTTNPELELQQRAVEFASLFSLGELRVGVLERMPPPELKATVTGIGVLFDHVLSIPVPITLQLVSENKPVGSTKSVCEHLLTQHSFLLTCNLFQKGRFAWRRCVYTLRARGVCTWWPKDQRRSSG